MVSQSKLVKAIEDSFNLEELRSLCFSLEIDYENLAGETKHAKIIALFQYFQRRNNLDVLIHKLAEIRPNVDSFSVKGVTQKPGRVGSFLRAKCTIKSWVLAIIGAIFPFFIGIYLIWWSDTVVEVLLVVFLDLIAGLGGAFSGSITKKFRPDNYNVLIGSFAGGLLVWGGLLVLFLENFGLFGTAQ